MPNQFSLFISNVMQLKDIEKDLKWYQKINPSIRKKIKNIRRNLVIEVERIKTLRISKQLLRDFQAIYIANIEDKSDPHIVLDNFFIEDIKPFFYTMNIKSYIEPDDIITINIVGETMTIFSKNHGAFTTAEDVVYENVGDYTSLQWLICNNIRDAIANYLVKYWL